MTTVAPYEPGVKSSDSATTLVNLSPSITWLVLVRDGFTCRLCDQRHVEADLAADLILPLAYGGDRDDVGNYRTLCRRCLAVLPQLEGVPPEPDFPEALQRLLALPGVGLMVRDAFRQARLGRQIRGPQYRSMEWYDALQAGLLDVVGWGKRRCAWWFDDDLGEADLEWACSSRAYDAVMRNLWNLLPPDVP